MTTIIILNWNGWQDTLACLDSLQQCSGEFRIVLVDNGSTDESVAKITDYIHQDLAHPIEFIPLEDNYGFARGNNEAIRRTQYKKDTDHYLLLNNDTCVEKDFLVQLERFAAVHPLYLVLSPLICYYNQPTQIWNAGGWLRFNFREYYYADQTIDKLPNIESREVTFLTGCALWFDQSLLDETGGILTERFFFGEEDFDFCLRMKRQGVKMACVYTSKIYHKVNSSTKTASQEGKIYIHYLNRFIDVHLHMATIPYYLWVGLTILYTTLLLRKHGWSIRKALTMLFHIVHEASYKTNVTKEDFLTHLNRTPVYD